MAPLEIDRARARAAFDAYVAPYDASNPRVALKIEHTLRVAELAEERAPRALRRQVSTSAGSPASCTISAALSS